MEEMRRFSVELGAPNSTNNSFPHLSASLYRFFVTGLSVPPRTWPGSVEIVGKSVRRVARKWELQNASLVVGSAEKGEIFLRVFCDTRARISEKSFLECLSSGDDSAYSLAPLQTTQSPEM